jgi:RHS repeat-associated protein
VQYGYDEVRYPDGGGSYSNRGRLTTVSRGSGLIYQQFNYNRMGKLVMQRQSPGGNAFEIQYTYNPGGQLIEEWVRGERQPPSWTYSLDEKRSFFYDVAGRLTSVNRGSHSAPQAAYASALSYNAAGALESLTYGNGATETKSYNSRLQTTSQSLVMAGVVLQRYDYQYGQLNQTTGAVDAMKNNGQLGRTDAFIGGPPQSPIKQSEERYSYDSLARLDIASEYRGDTSALTWQADYDYDRYGNRTQNGGQNYNLTYIPVQASEFNTSTNRFTSGVTYDSAGQSLSDSKFRGLQYQYNPEGRMIWSANLDGTNPATSVYDGLGQRIQTVQAGVTKSYFYDINGSVVAEYEATGGTSYGALKRLNVCAAGRLLAVDEVQTDGTKVTTYLMSDRQGSTRVLMNAVGAVTSRHDYLPFGEELGAGTGAPSSSTGMRTAAQGYSAADNVRQRYADTRLDDATGLDHTLWRKLETRSGRWTTPDPYGTSLKVANPQSFNRYAYVHNDPVNFKDPSGLDGDEEVGPGDTIFVNHTETRNQADGVGDLGGADRIVDPPADPPTGGPTVDPQNTNLLKISHAFGDASSALAATRGASKGCQDFFTKGRSLAEMTAIFQNFWNTVESDPSSAPAIAGTTNSGKDMNARLKLYAPFFADDDTTAAGKAAGYYWNPATGRYEEIFTNLTPSQYRGLIILHEFAHALGLIPSDKDDPKQSQKNDETIFEKCGAVLGGLPDRH